jgi:hypothetical protein
MKEQLSRCTLDILAFFHPFGWVVFALAVLGLGYALLSSYLAISRLVDDIRYKRFIAKNNGVDDFGDEE